MWDIIIENMQNDSWRFRLSKGWNKGARKHGRVEANVGPSPNDSAAIKYRESPWGVSIKPWPNKREESVNDRHFAPNILPRD